MNGRWDIDPAVARYRAEALSRAQRQVLDLLIHGMRGAEIAQKLGFGAATFDKHVAEARARLRCATTARAIALYIIGGGGSGH